jgi:hypothetical protein
MSKELNVNPGLRTVICKKIVQDIDFGQFLETNLGLNIKWRAGESGMCCCPLHNDDTPSFSVTRKDDGWVFNCFGCGNAGTIIHFFMEYYGISFSEALARICKEFNIKADIGELFSSMREMRNIIRDEERAINSHIVASNQCRILMKNCDGDPKVMNWVLKAYEGMNEALLKYDYQFMDKVCQKAESMLS